MDDFRIKRKRKEKLFGKTVQNKKETNERINKEISEKNLM